MSGETQNLLRGGDVLKVNAVKGLFRELNFHDVRIDRLVHATGFDTDGNEIRSITPGSNKQALLRANGGRRGPLAAEFGYGGGMVRVRLLRGYETVEVWDLQRGQHEKIHAMVERVRDEIRAEWGMVKEGDRGEDGGGA